MDPFQGINNAPITLHKYLYGNANPVNTIDPSGLSGLSELSVQSSILSLLSSVSVGSGVLLRHAIVATVVGVGVTILYRELVLDIILTMNESSGGGSDGSASDQAERQAEYDVMYRLTRMPPEPGNDCSSLAKNIHHANAVLNRYIAFDAKYSIIKHAKKIEGWKNRLEKLKKQHRKKCR